MRNALPTRQRSQSDREQVSDHFRTLLKDDLLSYSFNEVLEYFGRYLEVQAQATEAIGDAKAERWRNAHGFYLLMVAELEAMA